MRIGLVVPHIFMQQELLEHVIFSPGALAIGLVDELQQTGHEVTLFSPGPVNTRARNITADLSYFNKELALRGDTFIDLLKKHPLTFITLARQVQGELIARAYEMANSNELDLVHIYTNEEELALIFARFCRKPTVFTHHDPFNFLVQYRSIFPKHSDLNWLSMSLAQRQTMPPDTNWVGNIYHGLDPQELTPAKNPTRDYIAYLGRIIEPKGVHLAIKAIKAHNRKYPDNPLKLKIAGKHYATKSKNTYWEQRILSHIDSEEIEYVGFIKTTTAKQDFLSNAKALIVPSIFEEPFGMVMIEALACGTPIVGLNSGAIPEVIKQGETGHIAEKKFCTTEGKQLLDEDFTTQELVNALDHITAIDPAACRQDFEERFTLRRMAADHIKVYGQLLKNN